MVDKVGISGSFYARLKALGVPADEAYHRAGLIPRRGQDLVVSTSQMFGLWRAIREITGDPSIGLKVGREFRSESFDPLSIVAYSAPTFRRALEKLARYKRLCGAEELRIVEHKGLVRVEVDWGVCPWGGSGPLP